MTREWRLTYLWPDGSSGALYVTTLTRAGALSLFRHHFPRATVLQVEAVQS